MNGGLAPAPTGGEFVEVPIQKDSSRYAVTEKIVACLSSADNAYTTDTALNYIGATKAVQDKQAANPELPVWVQAVNAAKGRTSDNLGTNYPKISRADVDGSAEQPDRCEVSARRRYGCTSGGRGRNERQVNGASN